jgi:ribosomal protein S18 acetylase RimI-like enzyme
LPHKAKIFRYPVKKRRNFAFLIIRAARHTDEAAIWSIIEPTIQDGETYALPRDMTRQEALAYWMDHDRETFVAEDGDQILGTYYLRANQLGGGAHVSNCGYMTATAATGRGVARTMCLHSLERARAQGFVAMQFNFVVSTNTRAVSLWQNLGFDIVGVLPQAFNHPSSGKVDAFVMYQLL